MVQLPEPPPPEPAAPPDPLAGRMPRCPLCARGVARHPRECFQCGSVHHLNCWEYRPGCAVFGCGPTPAETLGWSRRLRNLTWRNRFFSLGLTLAYPVGLAELAARVAPDPFAQLAPAARVGAEVVAVCLGVAACLTLLNRTLPPLPLDPDGAPRTRRAVHVRLMGPLGRRPGRAGLVFALLVVGLGLTPAARKGGAAAALATLTGDPQRYLVLAAVAFFAAYLLVRATTSFAVRSRIERNRLAHSLVAQAQLRAQAAEQAEEDADAPATQPADAPAPDPGPATG